MRINITGKKEFVQMFIAELSSDGEIRLEEPKYDSDHSELSFEIGELATIVAIATGIPKIVESIMKVVDHLKKNETQILKLKSSFGTITLELKKDITADELFHLLRSLDPK
jgi:hypothetical protein